MELIHSGEFFFPPISDSWWHPGSDLKLLHTSWVQPVPFLTILNKKKNVLEKLPVFEMSPLKGRRGTKDLPFPLDLPKPEGRGERLIIKYLCVQTPGSNNPVESGYKVLVLLVYPKGTALRPL